MKAKFQKPLINILDTPTESQHMNNDIGLDTLQEMKEKEQFFEVRTVHTVWYHKIIP